jgi:hypothetical protein
VAGFSLRSENDGCQKLEMKVSGSGPMVSNPERGQCSSWIVAPVGGGEERGEGGGDEGDMETK